MTEVFVWFIAGILVGIPAGVILEASSRRWYYEKERDNEDR